MKSKQSTKKADIKPHVSLDKKFPGPKGPNKESELPPPKADPKSDPLPCCIIIDTTINTARTIINICIIMTALY